MRGLSCGTNPITRGLSGDDQAAVATLLLSVKNLVRHRPIAGSPLVRDYLNGVDPAASFFPPSPFRLESFRSKREEVDRRFDRDRRAAAAAALRPTSEAARERLGRFVEDGGAMITTGQQAGFLTGPLYTVYKALSAAALARHIERELGVLTIPVFWVASEDHDWEEANHTFLLDPQNHLRRVELPSAETRDVAMAERRIGGDDLEMVLEEVAQTVGGNNKTVDWVNRILGPYQDGATVGSAFGKAIAELLAPFDFCIADAADPALKRASVPALQEAVTAFREHEEALADRSQALEDAGFHPQVAVMEEGVNLFGHFDGGRERLYWRDGGFAARGVKHRYTEAELLEEIQRSPEKFSPNVFLRPVIESYLFPTLAYVGGPGELAYFAQVTALFEAYGIQPPVVYPRYSGLIVEPKVERLLEELDIPLEEVSRPREELIDDLARRQVPPAVRQALNDLREALTEQFEELIDATGFLDERLRAPLGSARNRALAEAERVETKILRSIKHGDAIAAEKLQRLLDSLHPNGAPQDRVLNVLPFVARYGEHFLREVNRSIEEEWAFPADG